VNVLGLSAYERTAAAALVSGGAAVAAASEEYFTRQRHDPSYPHHAATFCLERAGLRAQALDAVVFYEDPHDRFTRVLTASMGTGWPTGARTFVRNIKAWMGGRLWIRDAISRRLDIHPDRIHFVPRHEAYAAGAIAASGFQDAAILVADTAGAWTATALMSGAYVDDCLKLEVLEAIPYPHSLGLVCAGLADWLALPLGGERDLAALAAYGEPIFASRLRRVIQAQGDGTYRVAPGYFRFERLVEPAGERPFTQALVDLLGSPRDARRPLPFGATNGAAPGPEDQRFADAAASLQVVLEQSLLGLCRRLHALTGARRLCLAGPVAENASAVARIRDEGPFEAVSLPPEPGCAGAAAGAALRFAHGEGDRASQGPALGPYLGRGYDEARDIAALEGMDPTWWQRFRRRGCRSVRGVSLDVQRAADPDALASAVAEDLAAGKIVGWLQGRFEGGPRPLGNRALFVDPRSPEAARRLRERVTGAPSWRPPGLALAREDAAAVLTGAPPPTARWMQAAEVPLAAAAATLSPAVPADGRVLPQVVDADDNPRLHSLLGAFRERAGLGALLSADLCEDGHPPAASPADALLTFMRTEVDTLVLNDSIVRKTR